MPYLSQRTGAAIVLVSLVLGNNVAYSLLVVDSILVAGSSLGCLSKRVSLIGADVRLCGEFCASA